jgi:hypothetical protein
MTRCEDCNGFVYEDEAHVCVRLPIRYSTNWMGPINMDWIKKNGNDWAAGRIDCRGGDLGMFGEEIGLPIMKTTDWHNFSMWLRDVETKELYTLQQLVTEYELTNPKITWFKHELNKI